MVRVHEYSFGPSLSYLFDIQVELLGMHTDMEYKSSWVLFYRHVFRQYDMLQGDMIWKYSMFFQ